MSGGAPSSERVPALPAINRVLQGPRSNPHVSRDHPQDREPSRGSDLQFGGVDSHHGGHPTSEAAAMSINVWRDFHRS